MKDINRELEQILIKNGIINEICLNDIVQSVLNFETLLTSEKIIGLYGVGIETNNLLYFLCTYMKKLKIDVCFDKSIPSYEFKNHIKDTKVHKIESIQGYNIDYLIIGSYKYRDEMKQNLKQFDFKGKIIDFYDYLSEYIEEHFADYEMIFSVRNAYLKSDSSKKVDLIKKLIKYYLNIKDFKNAIRYIKSYIQHQYPEYEKYIQLEKDLNKLLEEIKQYLNNRNKKDIIVNWVDALPYNQIDKFAFLKSKTEEGVCFENAYTVMPWTRGTLRTILYGEYPIKDLLFLRKKFVTEEVEVMKLLKSNNYQFAYCGLGMYAKDFDDDVITTWDMYTNKNASSVTRQWDAISLMCKNDNPMLILIHTMYETHGPYICGEADTLIRFSFSKEDWEDIRCQKQAYISGQYIDNQLEYYEKFYGNNVYKIYMSDHGNMGDCIMEEHKIHVIFVIVHKNIEHETINGMFSLVDFPKVVKMVLKDDFRWKDLEKENVFVETYDAYDERKVKEILDGKLLRRDWLQCRGVISEQDKYFIYVDGEEYYFLKEQEEKNEIKNDKYIARIQELREMCNLPFIDIYKYDDFKNSRKLYE